mmetsp:Transcript_11880/g.22727  ORF Transcript_11880/g.22727 Transcript_11880/m.22727 type:complete len:99 (+) Transcript_11880:299-595(+)
MYVHGNCAHTNYYYDCDHTHMCTLWGVPSVHSAIYGEDAGQYRDRVQDIMSKASGLPVVDRAYKHKKALEDVITSGQVSEEELYAIQRAQLIKRGGGE